MVARATGILGRPEAMATDRELLFFGRTLSAFCQSKPSLYWHVTSPPRHTWMQDLGFGPWPSPSLNSSTGWAVRKDNTIQGSQPGASESSGSVVLSFFVPSYQGPSAPAPLNSSLQGIQHAIPCLGCKLISFS